MSVIKCQYCGKELKNQGAKNLHERHCSKNPNKQVQQQNNNSDVCEKGGQHEWRLLRASDKRENVAISKGYKEICMKCEEIK